MAPPERLETLATNVHVLRVPEGKFEGSCLLEVMGSHRFTTPAHMNKDVILWCAHM
jgi:hypothetical protein